MMSYLAPGVAVAVAIALTFVLVTNVGLVNEGGEGFVGAAVVGLLSTGLAVSATFGLMLYIGVPFHILGLVMPYLLIAIGIDDTFMLIDGWKAAGRAGLAGDPPERIAHTLQFHSSSVTASEDDQGGGLQGRGLRHPPHLRHQPPLLPHRGRLVGHLPSLP